MSRTWLGIQYPDQCMLNTKRNIAGTSAASSSQTNVSTDYSYSEL